MGWKNGVQYCQRNLEVALADAKEIVAGYVDDILIGNKRESENETKEMLIRRHAWTSNESYDN